MVNFIQKLHTENLLTINKTSNTESEELTEEITEELTEDLKWPCNNTRYIYWPEQSLNFRIEDNKIIVDTELKKDLLSFFPETVVQLYQNRSNPTDDGDIILNEVAL